MTAEQDMNQDSGYQSDLCLIMDGDPSSNPSNMSTETPAVTLDHTIGSSQTNTEEASNTMKPCKLSNTNFAKRRRSYEEAQVSNSLQGATTASPVGRLQSSSDFPIEDIASENEEGEARAQHLTGTVVSRGGQDPGPDKVDATDLATRNNESDRHRNSGQSSANTNPQLVEPSIKKENHETNGLEAMCFDQNVEIMPTSTFHDLPPLGNTTVPDEGSDDILDDAFDSTMDVTSDSMAEMMKNMGQQFNRPEVLPEDVDSDEEDFRARAKFAKIKEQFEAQRRSARGVTMEEQVRFSLIAHEEDTRIRVRKNRKQLEDDEAQRTFADESLFIPDEPSSHEDDCNDNAEHWYRPVSDAQVSKSTKESEAPQNKPKRGRPKGSTSKMTCSKPATKSGVSKKQSSKTTASKRGKLSHEPNINLSGLLNNNMIAVAAANRGTAPQPGFNSKNRQQALKQLIDSIPAEERDQYIGDKVDLDKALKNFKGQVRSDGHGSWILKGMRSSLHHYQLLGVSWMRSRENQGRHPKGGILSDDMGLGKTVSALANMVDGRPNSTDRGPRATLIIVPPALTNQWLGEVGKHVLIFEKVMVYSSKMKFLDVVSVLGQQDIVITSYHEVVRSLPKNNPPPHLYTPQAKEEWWSKEVEQHKGPLHQVHWHRIVLDEAQAIKNHLSKTSKAICRLKGRFRWCLSGTPVQNSLEEFYPYFLFLQCPNTGSFDLFKRNFAKPGSGMALQRLRVYLQRIMLRRTHGDKMFGRPIVHLPDIKPVETVVVKFNPVERAIYNIVKQRFVMKIKSMTKGGDGQSNYTQIFVLLLRLRQLVGHPILIQTTLKDLLESEDFERLWSITKDKKIVQSEDSVARAEYESTVDTLRAALLASPNPGAHIDSLSSARRDLSNTQLTRQFRAYLDSLRKDGHWAQANARSICTACGGPPVNPYVTSCLHIYCYTCLSDLRFSELMQNKDGATCMECSSSIKTSEAYAATVFGNADGMGRGIDSSQEPDEDIDWFSLPGPILRSAKIKGAVKKIKEWFEQDASNKIIVFTQFRGMIKVMERVCREESDWSYATYHGAMSFEHRDEEVKKFTEDPSCRILLAAIKAGGVGLNLVAANRVIVLDLWWNVSVETQAFARCYRIGQKREVEVVRFVVEGSIDVEIQRMQERKTEEIKQAMDQKNHPSLTLAEIIQLFDDGSGELDGDRHPGENLDRTGEDEPFIIPDDPYDEDHDENEDVQMAGTN